jgi:hypothetical protein
METTLRSFLSMRTERRDDIVDGEPGPGCIGLDACDERAKPALMVVWWMRLLGVAATNGRRRGAFRGRRPVRASVRATVLAFTLSSTAS